MQERGEIAGPGLLFGGPCSNLHAMRAVAAEVARRGAEVGCTGDLCAYAAHPAEMLEVGDVSLHRLDYDHRAASQAMRAVGLVQGYDGALETGWWPAEDMPPAALRRAGR